MTVKIAEQKVYLVGKQTLQEDQIEEFLLANGFTEWTTDARPGAEYLAETAGRMCYLSFKNPRPGGNQAYLDNIKKQGHGSVLEHAVWTLWVTGVSRSLTHELVRHRAGFAYSQLSQRYVDESNCEFVEPPAVRRCRELLVEKCGPTVEPIDVIDSPLGMYHEEVRDLARVVLFWETHMDDSLRRYQMLNAALGRVADFPEFARRLGTNFGSETDRRKFTRQAARSILPNATETKIVVTLNARAARHFIELRSDVGADPEIRQLAGEICNALSADSPNIFSDYTPDLLPDGTFRYQTECPKV